MTVTRDLAGQLDDDEQDWKKSALCAQTDPEAFFPEKGGSTREAKRICLSCEVKDECLSYALDRDERFGIWGGLSERERRKLKQRSIVPEPRQQERPRALTEEQQDEAITLLSQRVTMADIARHFGVSYRSVVTLRDRWRKNGTVR